LGGSQVEIAQRPRNPFSSKLYGSVKAQKLAVWWLEIAGTFLRVFEVDGSNLPASKRGGFLSIHANSRELLQVTKKHYISFRWPDEGMRLKLRYILT
jgi:hypothetical protein